MQRRRAHTGSTCALRDGTKEKRIEKVDKIQGINEMGVVVGPLHYRW